MKHGIVYEPTKDTKAEIYRAFLPLLHSGRIDLLDHPRLVSQLCGLERRTAWGGRESIDHDPGGHDDVANAAAGALVAASETAPTCLIQGANLAESPRERVDWRSVVL
jgi:hypothetical protein